MSSIVNFSTPDELYTRYIVIELIITPPPAVTAGERPNNKPKPQIFPDTGTNQVTLLCYGKPGYLTADVHIVKASGLENIHGEILIYGLDNSTCDAFSRLNPVNGLNLIDNLVSVYAGYEIDSNGYPPLIYSGPCRYAGVDYNNPSRPFKIISMVGLIDQNTYAPAINPRGTIALDTLFRNILHNGTNAYTYMPNNVTGFAKGVIYTGSIRNQLLAATSQHGYKCFFDGNTVYVAPIGQAFTDNIFNLNVNTGMIGYPYIDELGLGVRARLNNGINFGDQIQIDSYNPMAQGTFYINSLSYILQNRGRRFEIDLKVNNYFFQFAGNI